MSCPVLTHGCSLSRGLGSHLCPWGAQTLLQGVGPCVEEGIKRRGWTLRSLPGSVWW